MFFFGFVAVCCLVLLFIGFLAGVVFCGDNCGESLNWFYSFIADYNAIIDVVLLLSLLVSLGSAVLLR